MAVRTPSPNLGIPLCDFGGSGRDKHSLVVVPSKVCVVERKKLWLLGLSMSPLSYPSFP